MSAVKTIPQKFGRRYPWRMWFDRGRFTLVRGRDYNGRTDTFIQQLYTAAHRDRLNVGLRIVVSDDGNSVQVTVTPKRRGRGRPAGGKNGDK